MKNIDDVEHTVQRWYAVRCIFHWSSVGAYEERITLWRTTTFEEAITRAEDEASRYETRDADEYRIKYVGTAQASLVAAELSDDAEGGECFSLLRDSTLTPDEYVARFYATGAERQGQV